MPHQRFVLVSLQRIIHESEEIGSCDEVIFQDYDASEAVHLCRHAVDDVAGESPIFLALRHVDAAEAPDAAHVCPHFFHSGMGRVVTRSVGVDEQVAFRSQIVGLKGFDRALHVGRTVIDEEQDRGAGRFRPFPGEGRVYVGLLRSWSVHKFLLIWFYEGLPFGGGLKGLSRRSGVAWLSRYESHPVEQLAQHVVPGRSMASSFILQTVDQ